jgi:serine/threonine protein kinase
MLGQFLPRLRTNLPAPKVVPLTFLKAKKKFKGLKRLGRGAFGATYSARMNSRPVVVKVGIGTPGLVSPYQAIGSLKREVRILGRLQKYPFVPRILEVGVDYFVMEDVEGVSFLTKLVKGMDPRDILSVAVSQGIMTSILHKENVAHNDLDPKNILLTPNGVVIIDFGVSLTPEDGASEYREAMERDIITLLENVILAASSKSVPPAVRILLTSTIEKYKHVLNAGRVNEDTARDISRDLLFALSQLGARSARDRKLPVEPVKVIAV